MSKSQSQSKRLEHAAEIAAGRGYRLAFSLVGNRHDAEELVSQALTIATAKQAELPRKVWPWLAKVITFEARNMRRKISRRGVPQTLPEAGIEDDEVTTPLESAVTRELNERLWMAFRKLESSEREALALVTLAGFSKRQAAKELGISATSLRRQIDGALAKLQSELGVSKKLTMAALPLLAIGVSSSFIAGLGSTTGLQAATGSSLAITTGTIAGGLIMKKISAGAMALLLLLLAGWGLMLVFGEENSPTPSMADNDREARVRVAPEVKSVTPSKVEAKVEETKKPEAVIEAPKVPEVVELKELPKPLIGPEGSAKAGVIALLIIDEEGNPVADAMIRDQQDSARTPWPKASWQANAKGRADIHFADPGYAVIYAEGFQPRRIGLFQERVRGRLTTVTLRRGEAPRSLNVLVVDDEDQPVEGVTVYLHAKRLEKRYGYTGSENGFEDIVVSDADGRANFALPTPKGGKWQESHTLFIFRPGGMSRSPEAHRREYALKMPISAEELTSGAEVVAKVEGMKWIRGRVLRANGQPAARAEVSVMNTKRTRTRGGSRGRGTWATSSFTNEEGYYTLAAKKIEEIRVGAEWRHPVTGVGESQSGRGRFGEEGEKPDEHGNVDVPDIQLNKEVFLRFRVMIGDKPYDDASIVARKGGRLDNVGSSNEFGHALISNFRPAFGQEALLKDFEFRATGEQGESDWVKVEKAMRVDEEVVLYANPIAKGFVQFIPKGDWPEKAFIGYSLTEHDNPDRRLDLRGKMPEGWLVELPVGRFLVDVRVKPGEIVCQNSFVTVKEFETTEKEIVFQPLIWVDFAATNPPKGSRVEVRLKNADKKAQGFDFRMDYRKSDKIRAASLKGKYSCYGLEKSTYFVEVTLWFRSKDGDGSWDGSHGTMEEPITLYAGTKREVDISKIVEEIHAKRLAQKSDNKR